MKVFYNLDALKMYESYFWGNVYKSPDCWVWLGPKDKGGYGVLSKNNKTHKFWIYTHRLSWVLTHGEIPLGLCLLHSCDNPFCVRPEHLSLGTRADNVKDMDSKGRRGHNRIAAAKRVSKLLEEDVLAIRKLYNDGSKNKKELIEMYGVTRRTVDRIVTNRIWKNVI